MVSPFELRIMVDQASCSSSFFRYSARKTPNTATIRPRTPAMATLSFLLGFTGFWGTVARQHNYHVFHGVEGLYNLHFEDFEFKEFSISSRRSTSFCSFLISISFSIVSAMHYRLKFF